MGGGVDYRHRGSDAGDSRDVLSVRAYREAGQRGWYFEGRRFFAGANIYNPTIRNAVRPTVCYCEVARIRTKRDRADVRRFRKWDLAARHVLKRQHAPACLDEQVLSSVAECDVVDRIVYADVFDAFAGTRVVQLNRFFPCCGDVSSIGPDRQSYHSSFGVEAFANGTIGLIKHADLFPRGYNYVIARTERDGGEMART